MGQLKNWSELPSSKSVTLPGCSLVPKFFASKTTPDSTALQAISAKETADGWPLDVVQRAAARRISRAPMWVSPLGIALGGAVPAELFPGKLAATAGLLGRKIAPKVSDWPLRQVKPNGDIDPVWWDKALAASDRWFYNSSSAAVHLMNLVGVDMLYSTVLLSGTSGLGYDAAVVDAEILNLCASAPADGLWVCLKAATISPDEEFSGLRTVYVLFTKPPGMFDGVSALLYAPNYFGSTIQNATTYESSGFSLYGVYGEKGLADVLSQVCVGSTLTEAAHSLPPGGSRTCIGDVEANVVVVGQTTNVSGGPWSSQQSPYCHNRGVSIDSVFHIGDPEFVDRFVAIGATSFTSDAITVTTPDVFFDWRGQRLVDIAPSMSEAEQQEVAKLSVTTVVHAVAPSEAVLLSNTDAEKAYQANGETMRNEEMVAADPQRGNQSLTYGQVEARIPSADRRLYHRVLVGGMVWEEADFIVLRGDDQGCIAVAYASGAALDWDSTRCMSEVADGVYVKLEYTGTGDPFLETFGYTEAQLKSGKAHTAVRADFSETLAFGLGLPVLSKLSLSRRTSLWFVQCALNRKQFSSFVVGGCTMGSLARKKLV